MAGPQDRQFHGTLPVSWDRLHHDTRLLASQLILDGRSFDGIIAVSRGGLMAAAVLARELELRLVDTVCVGSYRGRVQGDLQVIKSVPGAGRGMLVIDDLADTGATARLVRGMLPEAFLVAIYVKPSDRGNVDMFVTEVPQDCWLLFPWDRAPRNMPSLVMEFPEGQGRPAEAD